MPRGARLDTPGTLHHVMIRGIERRNIADDQKDREDFVSRLGKLSVETGTAIYAWALMPNHAHILLRSGPAGLPKLMRRLLTGYASAYNRRHKRYGHLFQNRYKRPSAGVGGRWFDPQLGRMVDCKDAEEIGTN